MMFSKRKQTKARAKHTIDQHEMLLSHIEKGDGAAAEALWTVYWQRNAKDQGTAVVDVLNQATLQPSIQRST